MKVKVVFISLFTLSLISVQGMAEVRTSVLECRSQNNNQSANFKVTKKYDTSKRSLTFLGTADAIGEFEGQRVAAHAGASFNADPNFVDPLLPHFTVSNETEETLISIKPLNRILDFSGEIPELPFPGYSVQAFLNIKNDIGFEKIVLRGIIGHYRSGDTGKALNANAGVAEGNRILVIGNYDLLCSYTV